MNRRVLRAFLVLAAILVTVGSVANVFFDNSDVRMLAEQTGCAPVNAASKAVGPATCAMTKMERSPIEQSFELVAKGGVTVHVSCIRSGVLFGAYGCSKE